MNILYNVTDNIFTTTSAFLSLIIWMYLHSNFRGELRKTHILSSRLCNSRSRGFTVVRRSCKVVDFGTNRKRVCDFLLVINSDGVLSCIVSEIRRLIGWKYTPHSFSAFGRGEVFGIYGWIFYRQDYIIAGRWRFRDPGLRLFNTVPACDRRTDRQKDNNSTVANTGLCMSSCMPTTCKLCLLLL